MPRRQRSFFWRLLGAFILGGLLPFLALSVAFGTASSRILERAWVARSRETIVGAAELTRRLVLDASDAALELARSDTVSRFLSGNEGDPWLVSEINRQFSALSSSSAFDFFLIPLDGTEPLSRSPIPDEYRVGLYGGWGILGALSRFDGVGLGAERPSAFGATLFGQPHPLSGSSVPVAVGVVVRSDRRAVGYVVVDISRRSFSDRIGAYAAAGGSLTGLFLEDESGCVLYSMADGRDEATFADFSPADGRNFFVFTESVVGGLKLTGAYPLGSIRSYSARVAAVAVIIASLSALLSFAMAVLFSRSLARPVHLLTLTMERVAQGNLDARCEAPSGSRGNEELSVLIGRFNDMIGRVSGLVDNLVAQERELRRAETRALQAQINPHFLYNTLNSMRSMARLSGATDIADMAASLARIMREGSYPGSGFCTLGHSLDVARDYFAIEAARWPGRFFLDVTVDESLLDARIPRLIIQPIVENALIHGLEAKAGEGRLSVRAVLEGGDLRVLIRDSGAGMSAARLAQVRGLLREAGNHPVESSLSGASLEGKEGGSGTGIALVNTHRRLALIYGSPYGIGVDSTEGLGTAVALVIPFSLEES